ncbi:MAG: DMT family transporter [Alphaproteobacteria bacterium]
MGPTEWLLLVTLSVLWGGSYFFAEIALSELPPLTVVLGRVGIAALALIAAARALGHRLPRSPALWGSFLVMGAFNNLIPFSLIVWGQTTIGSGLAAILNATTPLFTVVLAHGLTRDERLTRGRAVGVLSGFAGVVIMIGPQALDSFGDSVLAQLACLGAALSYALAGIYGKRFRGIPPLITAAGQVSATTVMIAPLVLILDRPWSLAVPAAETWGAVMGFALLSTALAYRIYFRVLAAAGASNLLLVTLLIPVSALALGVAVLGEAVEPGQTIGMVLIGAGLAAIDGRPIRAAKAWLHRGTRRAALRSSLESCPAVRTAGPGRIVRGEGGIEK